MAELGEYLGLSDERRRAIWAEWNGTRQNPLEDLAWVGNNPAFSDAEKVYLAAVIGIFLGTVPHYVQVRDD